MVEKKKETKKEIKKSKLAKKTENKKKKDTKIKKAVSDKKVATKGPVKKEIRPKKKEEKEKKAEVKKVVERKEKTAKKEKIKEEEKGNKKYFEAVGRRKTSVARVRLFTYGDKKIIINGKDYKDYFPVGSLQKDVLAPLEKLNVENKYTFSILTKGGGISAQAGACRHGISRALIALNPYFRKRLKRAGFLTRDPRMRERKKFGLKRARKAPQWSKR